MRRVCGLCEEPLGHHTLKQHYQGGCSGIASYRLGRFDGLVEAEKIAEQWAEGYSIDHFPADDETVAGNSASMARFVSTGIAAKIRALRRSPIDYG